MLRPKPLHRALVRVMAAACLLLGACEGLPTGDLAGEGVQQPGPVPLDRPPLVRREGPRLPDFSGGSPEVRGWMKVEDLLWIDRRDEAAYRNGTVFDGHDYVSVDAASSCDVAAACGFRLRTDHLAVYTNTSWAGALDVAREAEGHVTRLVSNHGDALDLRLPEGPMKVVVTATRQEFEETLRCLVPDPVDWGAFYDARTGNVYVSLEPARHGPLPWRADLRHEMTHQILDLSRPDPRRGRAFAPPWFWLWEGIAIWAEELGGATGAAERRIARFRKCAAWGEAVPLRRLLDLEPRAFRGPHYDQTAALMKFLLDPSMPDRRRRVLELVGRLQSEHLPLSALEEAAGMSIAELDRRWRAFVER